MAYLYLALAIIAEVIATSSLKAIGVGISSITHQDQGVMQQMELDFAI